MDNEKIRDKFKENVRRDKKDFILFCSLLMREWGVFNLAIAGPLTIKIRKFFTLSLDAYVWGVLYPKSFSKSLLLNERIYLYYSTGKQFVSDFKNLRVRGLEPEDLEMEVSNALRRLGSKFVSYEGGMEWLKPMLLDSTFRSGIKDEEYDPDMMEKLEFIHDLTKGYKL